MVAIDEALQDAVLHKTPVIIRHDPVNDAPGAAGGVGEVPVRRTSPHGAPPEITETVEELNGILSICATQAAGKSRKRTVEISHDDQGFVEVALQLNDFRRALNPDIFVSILQMNAEDMEKFVFSNLNAREQGIVVARNQAFRLGQGRKLNPFGFDDGEAAEKHIAEAKTIEKGDAGVVVGLPHDMREIPRLRNDRGLIHTVAPVCLKIDRV